MRVFPVDQLARPAYYDRIPLVILKSYIAGLGPHANVVRWSYTPPLRRAAFIESLYIQTVVTGAPTVARSLSDYCQYTPFGGAATIFFINSVYSAVVAAGTQPIMTSFGYIGSLDKVEFLTADSGIDGTAQHVGELKGIEFQS